MVFILLANIAWNHCCKSAIGIYSCNSANHPYYVSVFQAEHNESRKSIEITCKIFTDDFERAIAAESGISPMLDTGKEIPNAAELAGKYLLQNFSIDVNGTAVKLKFLGKEHENDLTYCYLESTEISPVSNVTFKVTNLIAIYDEQLNIVHLKSGGITRSLLLNKNETSGTVRFP